MGIWWNEEWGMRNGDWGDEGIEEWVNGDSKENVKCEMQNVK